MLSLGIDIGTGSATAAVFDPDRGVLGRGDGDYPVSTPRPGWAEQDPALWWQAVRTALRRAITGSGADPASIGSLAVSGQGAAVVPLDESLAPLRPALIHLDQRATAEASRLTSTGFADAVLRASGNAVGSWNAAAKLCWLREHEPEVLRRARTVTSAAGFVLARLTGRAVQSISDAGISDLFDLGGRGWSDELADLAGVPGSLLPEVLSATAEVGPLCEDAAEHLGLRRTTVVRAGAEDTASAALAAGVLDADDAYLSLGTAGVVGVAVRAGTTREPRLLTFPHARDHLDLLSGSMTSAGAALTWWAGVTGSTPAELLAEADTADPGEVTFVPYLAGELHPVNDPHARGVFSGLSLATGRAELTAAIVAGSASAVAHNLEVAGAHAHRLYATGKPTASRLWMQCVADATGVPVEVTGGDAAAGSAIIAAGRDDADLAGLAFAHRSTIRRYEPRPEWREPARERRARTARLYQASRSTDER